VKNSFVQQFSQNIKFKYSCFDRVILRGYILRLFFPGGVVKFLRAMGFRKLSNGVMRILTDQLNAHILKVTQAKEIPIHWWPSVDGGKDGAKQKFVFRQGDQKGLFFFPEQIEGHGFGGSMKAAVGRVLYPQ